MDLIQRKLVSKACICAGSIELHLLTILEEIEPLTKTTCEIWGPQKCQKWSLLQLFMGKSGSHCGFARDFS